MYFEQAMRLKIVTHGRVTPPKARFLNLAQVAFGAGREAENDFARIDNC